MASRDPSRWALLLALLLVPAGCGRRAAQPTAPPPPSVLPPQVVAVYPPPRATLVRYDTPRFWARFAAPLDTATVSARTVYLKLDDGRVRIAVRWEPDSNAILIMPLEPLGLLKTYTLELSPDLATAEHVPLGRRYWWQFTVNSLYEPGGPSPPTGTRGESPFVVLGWRDDTNVTPGGVGYDLYAGTDSAAVAARAVPRLARVSGWLYLPVRRWAEDAANYWALTAVNYATAERLDGPVWRFDALGPLSARLDSVVLGAYQWGSIPFSVRLASGCSDADLVTSPKHRCGLAWEVFVWSQRLARASVVLGTTAAYADSVPTDVSLWVSLQTFGSCIFWGAGPPVADEARGRLATASFPASRRVTFDSDTLTAYLEAIIRRGDVYSFFLLRSSTEVHYVSPRGRERDFVPALVLRYYVPNP